MMVTIQLKNTSTTEAMSSNATPEEIAAANEIRSIYVSLLDVTDDTNIVKPYEEKIPVLGYNETVELTFQLQKDVESLKVLLNYPELDMPETRLILSAKRVCIGCRQRQFPALFTGGKFGEQCYLRFDIGSVSRNGKYIPAARY